MGPDGAWNQERLCWQRAVAIYWTGLEASPVAVESLQSAVSVRGWREMVASLQGRQPRRRGTSTVGSRYRVT
jgi:hypothetical protein